MNYALAIVHLGDRILGAGPFVQPFPGSERALTLAEVQELQTRLTKAGFDTGGTDGRVGNQTMQAVKNFQVKAGIAPADGYGGLKGAQKAAQVPEKAVAAASCQRITAGPGSGTATSATRNCTRSAPCQRLIAR